MAAVCAYDATPHADGAAAAAHRRLNAARRRDAMLPRPGHALGRVKARGIQAETLLIDERELGGQWG